MSAKLKVGIIGTGGIAGNHIAAYKKLGDKVEVVACCDIDGEKVKKYAERHGIPRTYTDAEEMMAAETLDAVSVCTWNAAHKPCTIAALRGGANVICEKPMALNAAEAAEMEAVAKEEGKLLAIGFVRRFGKDAIAIKEMSDGGLLGDVYYAKAEYLRRAGAPGGWFGDKAYAGGGPMIDLGVHVIDLVRYLAGKPNPTAAYAVMYDNIGPHRYKLSNGSYVSTSKGKFEFNVEDMASALIKFDSGLTLQIEASYHLNTASDRGSIEIFGTKAGLAIKDKRVEIYSDINGVPVNCETANDTSLDFQQIFDAEIAQFVKAAAGEEPTRSPAEDGVALMKILDAVYESARIGKEVLID
ncbi:MAG: Gfo/Idh/MocA family oxidoreductase [Oscillospiraceae bacterium]|jgi:predicted dehydrogenase|nr:Gfo/Idh/MocA family oxidoreductase [Oscillospiraceae bacterium]